MTVNKELFQKIHVQITAMPKSLDMNDWGRKSECGTTMCVAGWAVALSHEPTDLDWTVSGYGLPDRLTGVYTRSGWESGWESIANRAEELLGLDEDTAYELFHHSTDDEAREIVEEYASGTRD